MAALIDHERPVRNFGFVRAEAIDRLGSVQSRLDAAFRRKTDIHGADPACRRMEDQKTGSALSQS